MGAQEDRTLGPQLTQQRTEPSPAQWVHSCRGFIEDQHLRLMRQGRRKAHQLSPAFAENPNGTIGMQREIAPVQCVKSLLFGAPSGL